MNKVHKEIRYWLRLEGKGKLQKSWARTAHTYQPIGKTPHVAVLPMQVKRVDQAQVQRELDRLRKLMPKLVYCSVRPPVGEDDKWLHYGPAYRTKDANGKTIYVDHLNRTTV